MVVATPAETGLSTGRTRDPSARVLREPPQQLVQLGLLVYLQQDRQLLSGRNICIQAAQAKAMNLHALLSQLPGTCPEEYCLVVGMLAGCAGSWGCCLAGVVKTNPLNGFPFSSKYYSYLKSYHSFCPPQIMFNVSLWRQSMTLVTEDAIALHCWKNN